MVQPTPPRRDAEGNDTVPPRAEILSPKYYDAVIFELDGVVANTVELHFAAWKETFDTLLRTLFGRDFEPFNRQEFRQIVDGKPRREAIQSFLDARGITRPLGEELPEADEAMTNDTDTVYGLAKMRQRHFQKRIESGQLRADDEAVELIHKVIRAGMNTAAVSASEHAERVLSILDLRALFDVVVDGKTFADEGLAGKPGVDIFFEAATRLEATKDRVVIIENDRPGIEAGRGAGFGLIAVKAGDGAEKKRFLRRGADLAIERLSDFEVRGPGHRGSVVR